MPGIHDLAKKYERMAEIHKQIKPVVRDEIEKLIKTQFASGQDPYGNQWAELKAGGPSRLDQSGKLKGSLKVSVESFGVEVELHFIGLFHHKGWTRQGTGRTRRQRRAAGTIQVARPILSNGTLPPKWSEIIETEFSKCLASLH